MRYNEEAAIRLYQMANRLGLSGAEMLSHPANVMRECNGIGADWMPDCMTMLCTKLNPVMEIPAAIHDRRYMTKNISRPDADLEFLTNTIKVIKSEYAWWRPRRYILMRRAMRYYTYLLMFGETAWKGVRAK